MTNQTISDVLNDAQVRFTFFDPSVSPKFCSVFDARSAVSIFLIDFVIDILSHTWKVF